ncbi:hypothetical protein ACA910_008615 [Epithemia clementina (nom. ined.)]
MTTMRILQFVAYAEIVSVAIAQTQFPRYVPPPPSGLINHTDVPSSSETPSAMPSLSINPSASPFATPSAAPSTQPSTSFEPTEIPSVQPTSAPSAQPTSMPSSRPSASSHPSRAPSRSPYQGPTSTPTLFPTSTPSVSTMPSISSEPSFLLSLEPSVSQYPTNSQLNPDFTVSAATAASDKTSFEQVLVTIFIAPRNFRGRDLSQIGVQSLAIIILAFQEHLVDLIPHIAKVDLRITTVQEVKMSDGTVATTQAINGEVFLNPEPVISQQQLDEMIQLAFQGSNLTVLMHNLLLSGDPILQNINDIDYGIPPSLSLFAGSADKETRVDHTSDAMIPQLVILCGMAIIFLSGLLFFMFAAHRSRQNRSTCAVVAAGHEEVTLSHSDIPKNIESGDGAHGVTVSELAAESLNGSVSEMASLYSYRDQSGLGNATLDHLPDDSASFAPSYCFSAIEYDDESKVSIQSRTRSVRGSKTVDENPSNAKKPSRKQPKTDPATLYGFDDSLSFSSDKSSSRKSSRFRPKPSRSARPGHLVSTSKRTKGPPRGSKPTLKVQSLATNSFNINRPNDSESEAETDTSESHEVLSQVMEASETSSRDGSSASMNGHQHDTSGKHLRYNLMEQLDGDNSNDDEESLFMGPAAVMTRSDTVNPLKIDLGPLSNDAEESQRHESSELDTDDDCKRNDSTFNASSCNSSGDDDSQSREVTIV